MGNYCRYYNFNGHNICPNCYCNKHNYKQCNSALRIYTHFNNKFNIDTIYKWHVKCNRYMGRCCWIRNIYQYRRTFFI